MKKILMVFTLAAFTTGFAQDNKNKNEETETTTTKTYVKFNEGVNQKVDVKTKKVKKTKDQALELKNESADKTNFTSVMKDPKVKTDVSYGYEGNRYKFINQKDKDGYRLMTVQDQATHKEYAIIKPSSQNGYYIMSQDGEESFGYFNTNGDFVVEKYDAKNDVVVKNIYKVGQ
ncbi:hypothetical protein [uncultured Marixanthomonas sp.]|uniref:hypothetical protein n=1 Tax=uncultured Marixanthomonas sp. TaxID=757245 RepID=UPI0030DC6A1C|tara:strand:- start:19543 stop:20064 length:522 start_codon:yes stop_codon:yes gene_type:complete